MNPSVILPGLTLKGVDPFITKLATTEGRTFEWYHEQNCCESVDVHDVKGRMSHLTGTPILEVTEEMEDNGTWPSDVPKSRHLDSYTWTTITIRTAKGTVVVRWLGHSNGCYSESVSFRETTPKAAAG